MSALPRFLLAGTLAALLATSRPAPACINATMESDASISKLKEAERALETGDVLTARELATEVRTGNEEDDLDPNTSTARLYQRALRIETLARIRDASATPDMLQSAASLLEQRVKLLEEIAATQADSRTPTALDPALVADLGEALERVGRDHDALSRLVPIADRDLIGSAYAYAALSRAARRTGDGARADAAFARCETIATNPRVCRGEYPPRPLLRGKPLGYALPAGVFAAALLFRRLRRKRMPMPWASYGVPAVALFVLAAEVLAFWNARNVALATACAVAAVLAIGAWQKRAFLSAVRRGRIAGLTLRAPEAVDGNVPLLAMFFGPASPETLERSVDPSYRESARAPVLRIGRRPFPTGRAVALLLVGIVFAGCASVAFLTMRRSARPSLHETVVVPVAVPAPSASP